MTEKEKELEITILAMMKTLRRICAHRENIGCTPGILRGDVILPPLCISCGVEIEAALVMGRTAIRRM